MVFNWSARFLIYSNSNIYQLTTLKEYPIFGNLFDTLENYLKDYNRADFFADHKYLIKGSDHFQKTGKKSKIDRQNYFFSAIKCILESG